MIRIFARAALAGATLLLLAAPARPADTEAGRTLPDACRTTAAAAHTDHMAAGGMDMGSAHAGMDMGSAGGMDMTGAGGLDAAHRDLMQGMQEMHANMDEGMQVADIDAAFICGMIPHHQGAVDMARAELAHGKDPWARALARRILDGQAAEIAEMIGWVKSQPQ